MNVYWHLAATLTLKLSRWHRHRRYCQQWTHRQQWLDTHINHRASTVRTQFAYFRHVIPVDYRATYTPDPMAWVLTPELKAMAWPARLSEHAIFVTDKRVVQRADDWEFDDWAGYDQAFVMTNNDEEALWITLKYSY